MERSHHLIDANSRVSRNIRIRAERLARSGSVRGMDAGDIAQDLRLDLIERGPRYDPARASFETFADRVAANRIATLAAPTARLRAERGMRDLNGTSGARDGGEGLPLADTLPRCMRPKRSNRTWPSGCAATWAAFSPRCRPPAGRWRWRSAKCPRRRPPARSA
jgi:DNA-directed RNA polymerase specialized sigma24 family protein